MGFIAALLSSVHASDAIFEQVYKTLLVRVAFYIFRRG